MLVNKTMTSLTLQYYTRSGQGAHTGFEIKYKGTYKADRTKIFEREYIIRDGLQFTISSLHVYTEYALTITPLEVQMVLAPITRKLSTQEGGMSSRFSIFLLNYLCTKIPSAKSNATKRKFY